MTAPQPPQERLSALRRVGRIVGVIEISIGAICLLTILILVFFQALQRYLPIEQLAWTGEIARFALVWLTFSAAGLLVTTRGHIALEIVDSFKNQTVVRVVQIFAMVIVAATGLGLALEAIALIQTQGILKSPVLRIPMSWVYIPLLIGAVSTMIRALIAAIDIAINGPVAPSHEEDAPEVTA